MLTVKSYSKILILVLTVLSIVSLPINPVIFAETPKERFISIAAGSDHSLAVSSDGSVWAWGWNQFGQLGDGTLVNRYSPIKVQGLTNVVSVSAGCMHSTALKKDGTVVQWGMLYMGEDDLPEVRVEKTPVKVIGLHNIKSISEERGHVLALKDDGTVLAWGCNSGNQLGDGTNIDRIKPVKVKNLEKIKDIATGNEFSIALKKDGTVWIWGNDYLKRNGYNSSIKTTSPKQISNLNNVIQITANYNCIAALKKDGTVWTWGRDYFHISGKKETKYLPKPIKEDKIGDITKILSSGNTLIAIGKNGSVTTSTKLPFNNYKVLQDIVCGEENTVTKLPHTLVLKKDGTLWSYGNNYYGSLGNDSSQDELTPSEVIADLKKIKAAPNGDELSIWAKDPVLNLWESKLADADFFSKYKKSITYEEAAMLLSNCYEHLSDKEIPISQTFSDIETSKYNSQIKKCLTLGIVNGLENTKFSPEVEITKQDLCLMIYNLIKAYVKKDTLHTMGTYNFTDSQSIDNWAIPAITYLYENKILSGTSELKISPKTPVTREQALTLVFNLQNFLRYYSDTSDELQDNDYFDKYTVKNIEVIENKFDRYIKISDAKKLLGINIVYGNKTKSLKFINKKETDDLGEALANWVVEYDGDFYISVSLIGEVTGISVIED